MSGNAILIEKQSSKMTATTAGEPSWEVEVDRATDAEWSQMLDLFDDATIYQTAAYGVVRWGAKNLSRIVLKRNGEVVSIAQLRILRPTPLKYGIAYLRWGPLWERRGIEVNTETPARMVRAIQEEYVVKRKLFLRVIPNAFPGTKRGIMTESAFHGFLQEPPGAANAYRTFVVDLSPSVDELRKQLDPKWRNKLSGAERNELTIVSGIGIQEYRTFLQIYSEMRSRKNFDTTVDVEEFGRIQESLPESQRMRVLLCEQKGLPVAGIVISAIGNSAIYLLGATADEGLKAKGAYLLQWAMIKWLKESGIRWYDLCGIDPVGNPGVYTFKKGLSGSDVVQLSPRFSSGSTASFLMARAATFAQRVAQSRNATTHKAAGEERAN